MKQLLFLLLIFCSFSSMAQKISVLPAATGTGVGSLVPIVQGGVTKQIVIDSLISPAKRYADSLQAIAVSALASKQATLVSGSNLNTLNGLSLLGSSNIAINPLDTTTIYSKINQNVAAIGTKQTNLQSGININTINGLSLLGASNIVISGASSKALYKDLTLVAGGTTLFNFDSSSTAKLTTSGLVNIDITGSVATGATGILAVTQSAAGNDTLRYNNVVIGIAKQPNKTSLVGFVKLANSFIFSVDTTNISIGQTGGFDSSALALFTAASTNTSYKTAVNNAIIALKGITLAAGGTAWSKSVMINGRAGTNLTQQSFNWKNPAQYNYTYNGTFTYNPNGTQFDGSTNYISTGITPSTAYTGTTTDVSYVNVVGANPTPVGFIFGGANTSTGVNLYTQVTATNFTYEINGAYVNVASPATTGRFIMFYSSATVLNSYRNGTLLDSRTLTNPNLNMLPYPIYEGAASVNNSGTPLPQYFSSARIDVTQIINSKLTVAESQAIDAVWATYQTALSR